MTEVSVEACYLKALCYFLKYLQLQVIGPLHDPVTWYGINYIGTQVTQWNFPDKGKSGWTGMSSFVLEVPLCNLSPSRVYSVPCDRIVQRTYSHYKAIHDNTHRQAVTMVIGPSLNSLTDCFFMATNIGKFSTQTQFRNSLQ